MARKLGDLMKEIRDKIFVIIFIAAFLLISGQIFAAENSQRTISRVHLEEVQAYFNKVLDFHEKTLKEIVMNLPKSKRDWYAPLHQDYQVIVEPDDIPNAYADLTTTESQKYIYVSIGYLWTEVEIDGKKIKWEIKNEAEIAGILAHELMHLVSAYDRKMTPNSAEEYLENEVMADALAVGLLLEERYQPLTYVDSLEKYLEIWYDMFGITGLKQVFQKQIQLVREMILEAIVQFPSNEYKDFIITTQEEFERIKDLLKSGEK